MTNKLNQELQKQLFQESVQEHQRVLTNFEDHAYPVIKSIVDSVLKGYQQNAKLLLIGNGGSAADCQHIAGELMGRFKLNRIPLPAISLVTDTSLLTCISNDFDYESLFSRQIEALGNQGDILWALSTSGTSANILKAAQMARIKGMKIISFTGQKQSELEKISDICLCAATADTGHAQEIHQVAYHIVCKIIDQEYDEVKSV